MQNTTRRDKSLFFFAYIIQHESAHWSIGFSSHKCEQSSGAHIERRNYFHKKSFICALVECGFDDDENNIGT